MNWQEACEASINDKAKRNNDNETWLIVDKDSYSIYYDTSFIKFGDDDGRKVGPRGPIALVLVESVDSDGNPTMRTKKTVDVATIEKYDDWRPSVPKIIAQEVKTLDELI